MYIHVCVCVYIYIYIYIWFSIMTYYRITNIVPVLYSINRTLLFIYFVHSTLYLLFPNS